MGILFISNRYIQLFTWSLATESNNYNWVKTYWTRPNKIQISNETQRHITICYYICCPIYTMGLDQLNLYFIVYLCRSVYPLMKSINHVSNVIPNINILQHRTFIWSSYKIRRWPAHPARWNTVSRSSTQVEEWSTLIYQVAAGSKLYG